MSAKRKGMRTTPSRGARPAASVPTELLFAKGMRAQTTGDMAGAESAFRQLLANDPKNPDAIQMLGALLVERNDIDEAMELFESGAAMLDGPSLENFGFFNNYANALRRAGKLPSAEKLLRRLTEIAPREWQPWHNLGQTLKDLERNDEAAAALRRAVMLEPGFGPNHGVLGEVLHRLGRLHSADAAFRRCFACGWTQDQSVWTLLGNNLRLLGDLDGALDAVMRALELSGGHPSAMSNVAVVYTNMGRFDEAVEWLEKSIALDADNATTHCYLGYALLASGRLEPAFEHWEYGIRGGPRGAERETGVPRWTIDDGDVRVLVYREQGVGDEIMFASMYPDLVEAAREVVIECDGRLIPLFQRSFPRAEVRAQSTDAWRKETMHDYDRSIPAGSLMQWFRPTVDSYPGHAYLVADDARVDAWRARLAELGPAPYVGISWRSRVQTAERRLEYTRLEEWADVFGVRDVTWVNLQYDKCDRELHDAEQRFGVQIHRWDWLDLMNDFDEVAALMSALDLVVAPFNAVSMLSGALGIRTVALGNRFGWNCFGTERLPWYSSVTLALRTPPEEWDHVLATTAREVAAAVERASSHV